MEGSTTTFHNRSGFQADSQNFNGPTVNNTLNIYESSSAHGYSENSTHDIYKHDKALRQSLTFPQRQTRRSNVVNPHLGTCQWIVQLDLFKNWRNSVSGLLWIKGKPGAGKSTVMKYIHTTLQQKRLPDDNSTIFLDFFFHARGTDLQKSPLGMLRSLLYQLYNQAVQHCQPLLHEFDRKWIDYGFCSENVAWEQAELTEIFQTIIFEAAKTSAVTIFVDALDEAGEHYAQKVAELFHDINDRATNELDLQLKTCISSRDYPIYGSGQTTEIRVDRHNDQDIEAFVLEKLSMRSIRTNLPLDNAQLQDLSQEILRRASGVFQWVVLVVDMVKAFIKRGESLSRVKSRLGQLPPDLGKLYDFILEHIIIPEYRRQAFHLFQLTFLSTRPLDVYNIRDAVAAMDGCVDRSGCFGKDVKSMTKQITAWSAGLVEVFHYSLYDLNGNVQVVHESINDYLRSHGLVLLASLANGICEIPRSSLSQSDEVIGYCHRNLYQVCFDSLTMGSPIDWSDGVDGGALPDIKFEEAESTWYDYVCNNIFYHASQASNWSYTEVEEQTTKLSTMFPIWYQHYPVPEKNRKLIDSCYEWTTLMHEVSEANWVSAVECLIQNGHTGTRDQILNTPLHVATLHDRPEVIKLRLDNSADCLTRNKLYQTPLTIAAGRANAEVIRMMLDDQSFKRKKLTIGLNRAFVTAAGAGNLHVMELLISSGASTHAVGYCETNSGTSGIFNVSAKDRLNAMQAASQNGHDHVIEFLVSKGSHINSRFGPFDTALQAACASCSVSRRRKTLQLLLNLGANVNAIGGYFGSALHAACQKPRSLNVRVISLLLDAGADINIVGGCSKSVVLAALTNHGTDSEWRAMALFNEENSLIIIKTLINAGADVNICNAQQLSPLCIAIATGRLNVCSLLLDRGANHSLADFTDLKPLHYAAAYDYNDLVQRLINEGAEIDSQDTFGRTPLHYALYHRASKTTDILINSGANMSIRDGYGWTASEYTLPDRRYAGCAQSSERFRVSSLSRSACLRKSIVRVAQEIIATDKIETTPGFWEIGHCLVQLEDDLNALIAFRLGLTDELIWTYRLRFCSRCHNPAYHSISERWLVSRTRTETVYCMDCKDDFCDACSGLKYRHSTTMCPDHSDSDLLKVCCCSFCFKILSTGELVEEMRERGVTDVEEQRHSEDETDAMVPQVESPFIYKEPSSKPISVQVRLWLQTLIERYS